MARKVLGYIELVWTCDSCGTKNPGAIRSCTSCGAPQPVDVKFERVDPATFNFIKDEALIRMAKAGPDKHCPYCGTRNTADAQICVECGGDLTVGAGTRRRSEGFGRKIPKAKEQPSPESSRSGSRGSQDSRRTSSLGWSEDQKDHGTGRQSTGALCQYDHSHLETQ